MFAQHKMQHTMDATAGEGAWQGRNAGKIRAGLWIDSMLPVENAKAFNAWLKYWVSTAGSRYSELAWLRDTLCEI